MINGQLNQKTNIYYKWTHFGLDFLPKCMELVARLASRSPRVTVRATTTSSLIFHPSSNSIIGCAKRKVKHFPGVFKRPYGDLISLRSDPKSPKRESPRVGGRPARDYSYFAIHWIENHFSCLGSSSSDDWSLEVKESSKLVDRQWEMSMSHPTRYPFPLRTTNKFLQLRILFTTVVVAWTRPPAILQHKS